MKKFLFLTALLSSLLLAACSAPVAPAAEASAAAPAAEASAAAPAADRGLYPVTSRLADGSYYQSTWFEQGPYGSRIVHTLYGAWIDIRVQNLAYAKEVGLVYTTDGWLTNAKAAASYELPLDNGTERWGVDFKGLDTRTVKTVEYAIYTVMNGVTYWDNNGGLNYKINLYY